MGRKKKKTRRKAIYGEIPVPRTTLNALHTFFKLQNYSAKCFDAPSRDGDSGSERKVLRLKFSPLLCLSQDLTHGRSLAPDPGFLQNMHPVF